MTTPHCAKCEQTLGEPAVCVDCYNELAQEAQEARHFYSADGSFVEMDPAEVKARRIAAARAILDLQEQFRRMVQTERDRLAAMAMQGLAAHYGYTNSITDEDLASWSYALADAMLAARAKREPAP